MAGNGTLVEGEGILSRRCVTAVVPGGWRLSGSRSDGASMKGSWYLTILGFWELRPPGILCPLPISQETWGSGCAGLGITMQALLGLWDS